MKNKNFILAFIPARGGSKGIPKKNIIKLNNKPLIQYTLDLCRKNLNVDDYFVSTDSIEIKKVLSKLNYINEYKRPKNLSSGSASIVDTVLHGVKWYEKKNKVNVNSIILLQPTSPIRDVSELNSAINFFKKKNLKSLFSTCCMRESPYECIELSNNLNSWKYLKSPSKKMKRRQDYSKKFGFIDGSFYISNVDFLRKKKSFIVKGISNFFLLGNNYKVDIDEKFDLFIAEKILNN